MGLTFNSILEDLGVEPRDVRLLRHTPDRYNGRTLYALWRDGHPDFMEYQATQVVARRGNLNADYWASFVVTPAKSVMFVGLFRVKRDGSCPPGAIDPVTGHDIEGADHYSQELVETSRPYIGRVFIEWGNSAITWVQRPDRQPKAILEISRVFQEEAFPGYTTFISDLSAIAALPGGWHTALRAARGIYLLTCPRTKE